MRESGRRGKAPAETYGMQTLGAYVRSALPATPRSFDHSNRVNSYPMALNSHVDNSPLAAAIHFNQMAHAMAGEVFQYPGDDAMLDLCNAFEVEDGNLSIFEVLESWMVDGIFGTRLIGFVPLDINNRKEMSSACNAFGGVILGLDMPFSAEEQFDENEPWRLPMEDYEEGPGHAVLMTGANVFGIDVITWGTTQSMTWGFWEAYGREAWVAIPEILVEANHAPCWSIDLNRLVVDLENL